MCEHSPKVVIGGFTLSVCADCRAENIKRYRAVEEGAAKSRRARRLCAGYRSTCPWGGCQHCMGSPESTT